MPSSTSMPAIVASAATTGIVMALVGIAVVLVISAVFYAIGRGEDRDRAQATGASSSTCDDDAKVDEDPARHAQEPDAPGEASADPAHDGPAATTRPAASPRRRRRP